MHVWMWSSDGFHLIPIFETAAICVIFALALFAPKFRLSWPNGISEAFSGLAVRPKLAAVVIGLVAFIEGIAVLAMRVPEPRIHDEFSYLLAGDTYAAGRITNPQHPMWEHFRSPHILHNPTYMSKYPPAQGLILGLGKVIGGHPIVGVKLGFALACVAIFWMLRAWVPPGWALLGGLIAVGRFGGFGYWSQSYWGTAVAAAGGALVFGALRRIVARQRPRDALILALGLAILANSRPFEGFLVSLPVAVLLLAWATGKNRPAVKVTVLHVILPTSIVLLLAAVLMGINNYCVTGNAFMLPYQVYEVAESRLPHLTLNIAKTLNSLSGLDHILEILSRANRVWFFYIGLLLTVPLVLLPWRRDGWTWFAMLTCGLFLAVTFVFETWFQPHYAAPVAGLILFLVLQGMRQLRSWRRHGKPTGRLLVRGLLLCVLLSFFLTRWLQYEWIVDDWYTDPKPWNYYRAKIHSKLEEEEGAHLIIVRYSPEHYWYREWVYNGADIDASKVVWAHDLEEDRNRELIAYFGDRRVWTVEADETPPTLIPYNPIQTAAPN